jgi:hypothetical protein
MIVDASEFSPDQHIIYTRPKANQAGGKSVGILNTLSKKALYLHSPLMMTWGAAEFEGNGKFDMSLQFPREEFTNPAITQFLKVLTEFENKIKKDARINSRDWFGKQSLSEDVVEALFSPMLKYRKDQKTGEPDKTSMPTLKVKLPVWDGKYNFELFDTQNNRLIPNETGATLPVLIPKGCEVACILVCGGIWFANGKFGLTWKAYQIVVKPTESLKKGECHIKLGIDSTTPVRVDTSLTEPAYDSDGESSTPKSVSRVTESQVNESVPTNTIEQVNDTESQVTETSTEAVAEKPKVKVSKKKA